MAGTINPDPLPMTPENFALMRDEIATILLSMLAVGEGFAQTAHGLAEQARSLPPTGPEFAAYEAASAVVLSCATIIQAELNACIARLDEHRRAALLAQASEQKRDGTLKQ